MFECPGRQSREGGGGQPAPAAAALPLAGDEVHCAGGARCSRHRLEVARPGRQPSRRGHRDWRGPQW